MAQGETFEEQGKRAREYRRLRPAAKANEIGKFKIEEVEFQFQVQDG